MRNITIRNVKPEDEPAMIALQHKCVAAREAAFGYPLQTFEILAHFTGAELWQGGTSFTAFSNGTSSPA